MNTRKHPWLILPAIAVLACPYGFGAPQVQAAPDAEQPRVVAALPGTVTPRASIAQLEWHYELHSRRRDAIAGKLSVLWLEERELMADIEEAGRTDAVDDIYELEAELACVRAKIDAARAELSQENRIIQTVSALLPDD